MQMENAEMKRLWSFTNGNILVEGGADSSDRKMFETERNWKYVASIL